MSYQTDVIGKPVTSKEVKNGNAVVGVDKSGNKEVLEPETNKTPSPTDVHSRYDTRFDDADYYSS